MKKRATFLSWIGKNTMVIYVLHFWENRILPISNIYQKLNLSVCRLMDPFIWWICIVDDLYCWNIFNGENWNYAEIIFNKSI